MAHKKPPEDGLERRLREAKDRRSEPRREQALRLLDQFQNRPLEDVVPALSAKPRRPKRSKAKGSARADAMARSEVNKLVPKEAQRQGDYQFSPFEFVEVTEGGKRVKKERKVVRNMGGTPIQRWNAKGHFNERQMAAILFYQEAFRKVFGEGPRVTGSYSPVIIRGARGAVENYAASRVTARESLRLIDNEVNFKFSVESGFWPVWQNVVIFDESAGVAGGLAGYRNKQAEAAARVIVTMIASMIADLVIDQPLPRDMRSLLLDVDAPRRPGRRG